MSVNEGHVQDTTITTNSVDPNVRIPEHITANARAADELHNRMYPKEATAPEAPAKDAAQVEADAAAAEAARAAALAAAQPAPEPTQDPAPSAADANVSGDEWRHRFLSMQGRYNASVRNNASMQEQMNQLATELARTQNLLSAAPQQQHQPVHNNVITDADRETYGDDLIDLTRRAALDAVKPELDNLRAENQSLRQSVQVTDRERLFQSMDSALPIWRKVNTDNRFKAWLRLPNVYTGKVRQETLNEAVGGANAPLALQVFKDFLAEARATGQQAPGQQQIEPQAQPAPREPAVALETLAAPGRARPASGDSQVPSEKPIYSRADISKFYDEKRKGLWAHRQAEADAKEADLIAAQSQGRIR